MAFVEIDVDTERVIRDRKELISNVITVLCNVELGDEFKEELLNLLKKYESPDNTDDDNANVSDS